MHGNKKLKISKESLATLVDLDKVEEHIKKIDRSKLSDEQKTLFEYWNNNGLYDRFIEILTENKNSTDPLYYYYTQGVLNILFFNNYKQIDYKYNVTLSDVDKEPFFRNLVETINNEYAIDILHFNGRKIFNKNINIDIKDKCIELYKKYDIMNIL